jgi:predicted ATPase/tRNA A-37 threonylcarbamoyl transferase component Bud32
MSSVGVKLGRLPGTSYSLVRSLGAGATAEVFLATHDALGKRVAIKLLREAVSTEQLDRLRAEARLLARITHPALVGVYDLGVTADGRAFFAMDYVEGETMANLLKREGRLAPAAACELVAGILDGLAAAHHYGIVHRDVKPANVIVGIDGKSRVLDFGVAKMCDEQGHGVEMAIGTPNYMAPEQVLGERVGPSADLYAAGCVLFTLVTGAPPFVSSNQKETLQRQIGESPPTLAERLDESVNVGLEALIAQALSKDPSDRPQSAEVMAAELRRLAAHARGEASDATRVAPASARMPSTNVRELPTAFVGRERELASLAQMFARGDRLVTLLGPGGSGKTRLAKRYAVLHQADYAAAGGTWFVALAEARGVSDVVARVARVTGVSLQGGRDDEAAIIQLGRSLSAHGPALLVLDNCEQAAAEIAQLVSRWLEAAPGVCFLMTSRERLGVAGERSYEVTPLGVPEAVLLFVDRTRLVRADYVVGAEEAPVVTQIVQALDGIPLAIELAAARMGLLSATVLLERLGKRFELLASTNRDAAPHQRTLMATIDWSWMLLEPWEQAALAQCAVFHGGFTLEAAEAALSLAQFSGAPTTVGVLQRLRDKSLVYSQPSRDFPSELRLGLYESIRAYASIKLAESGDADATNRRHAEYFLREGTAWARRANRGSSEHLRRLALEVENLRAVHERALGGDPKAALQSADILHTILYRRAPLSVTLDLANRTLESEGVDREPVLLASVLFNRCNVWRLFGAAEELRRDAERLLEIARDSGDAVVAVEARTRLALSESFRGGSPAAREEHSRAAVKAARISGDWWWQGRALTQLGATQLADGRPEEARDTFLEVIRLVETRGDVESYAGARCNLGVALLALGQLDEAERAFEEGIAALRTLGHMPAVHIQLYNLACLRHERGDYEQADRGYREVIADMAQSAFVRGICLAARGVLLAARDDIDGAKSALDQADKALSTAGETYAALVAIDRGHLDLAMARRAAREGDVARASAHRDAAGRRLTEATSAPMTDDVRMAHRWLERALALDGADGYPADAWIVARDGGWFRSPRGWRVGIESRVKARQVLCVLVRARLDTPGRILSVEQVLEAGWPGERVMRRAAEARVYNIINMLRSAGMREVVLSRDGGYVMDPTQVVVLA